MILTPAELAATVEKIDKINARAAKRGFTGKLVLNVERADSTTTTTDDLGFTVTEVRYSVTVDGEAPCYNGFRFVATLDWDENAGLITRVSPGIADAKIDRSALVEGYCDHCKIDRQRNLTFLVENVSNGNRVQVGSTCIKDFLGWSGNPVFLSVDEVTSEVESFLGGGRYADRTWATETVLAVAWAAIKARGWTPASGYGMTTRQLVSLVLDPRTKLAREEAAAIEPFVADSIDHAKLVREFILSDEFSGDSEYVVNLKAVAAGEFVSSRNFGLLVSAPQAYARYQGANLIKKVEKKASEFIGTVGEKITFEGEIETIRYIENAYGTTVLYLIRNAESGNIVKWFASRAALGDDTGKLVKITGKVKAHETYREVRSTVLTYCKIA